MFPISLLRAGSLSRWIARLFCAKQTRFRSAGSVSASSEANESNAELSRVTQWITKHEPNRIVVLAGAGISTASGIPDFRSPGSGLYDNLSKYRLPYPEAVFDLEYFYSNPAPFYALAKDLYPTGRYRPNHAHYFMRLLHEKSRLLRVYTQNIDSLERMAGLPTDKLVEAHGTFLTATCIVCRAKAPSELVKDAIYRSQTVPRCPACHEVIKPDIVFFGEELPERFWMYRQDLAQTDLVLIMGTSLEVYPFAGIADHVPSSVPRVLFNRDAVGSFRKRRRSNDFVILGSITKSIERLTKSLNWHEELVELMDHCESSTSTRNGCPSSRPGHTPNQRPYSTTSRRPTDRSPSRAVSVPSKPPHRRHHRRSMSPVRSARRLQSAAIADYLYRSNPSFSSDECSTCDDSSSKRS